uniref:Peptidase S1 domain-containing protein n=1 Tax=Anopheles epiroticus TaxID=199890 RepID=A0A182PPE6_9DIPT
MDANIQEYPFVAAIAYAKQLKGNGAILSRDWILTSGGAVALLPDGEYDVLAGSNDFNKPAQWIRVWRILRHPEYVGWDYDIALVQAHGGIEFSQTVQPININPTFPETVDVTMLSYGANEHGTATLRKAPYTLISDNIDCIRLLREYKSKQIIWQRHGFCLIPPPGTERAQWSNDTGAPLVVGDQLFALFAYAEYEGVINGGSVAIRVTSFTDWIEKVIARWSY